MVAHDVDHRRAAAAGVVEVGQPVAEARPEVQERGGRLAGHAGVAVRRRGHDPFEQAEDAAHLGHGVEGGDEVHLRRARIGETHIDAGVDESTDEGLCAVGGVGHVRSQLPG